MLQDVLEQGRGAAWVFDKARPVACEGIRLELGRRSLSVSDFDDPTDAAIALGSKS
ncbi:hypothetical protein D3C83_150350 [compost metagenome]